MTGLAPAERDAAIVRLKDEGLSRAAIRARLGVSKAIVDNALGTAKRAGLLKGRALVPLNGELLPPEPHTRPEFASAIATTWRKAAQAFFEAGDLLVSAKEALPHGEFEAMVEADLPFGPTTARRLMIIARDGELRAHVHDLPPHWGTLYELTKLDPDTRAARFADGTIRPEMERREISQVRKKLARQVNHALLAREVAALPERRFCVAVEDFEWDFEVRSRETGMDRHASNHYPTATDAHTPEEIVERTRERMRCLADDCLLAMWVTVPHLAIGIDVMRLRGFRYVSSAVWIKYRPGQGIGTGYWFRVDHELLLIGVRGEIPCPLQGDNWRSVFEEPGSRVHSRKTEEPLAMIEAWFADAPDLPKIEFNRIGPARPGWDAWGNEVPGQPGAQAEGVANGSDETDSRSESIEGQNRQGTGVAAPDGDASRPGRGGGTPAPNAPSPSNRDASTGDEPSSGAAPQGEAPHAGIGCETPAGREGRHREGAATDEASGGECAVGAAPVRSGVSGVYDRLVAAKGGPLAYETLKAVYCDGREPPKNLHENWKHVRRRIERRAAEEGFRLSVTRDGGRAHMALIAGAAT